MDSLIARLEATCLVTGNYLSNNKGKVLGVVALASWCLAIPAVVLFKAIGSGPVVAGLTGWQLVIPVFFFLSRLFDRGWSLVSALILSFWILAAGVSTCLMLAGITLRLWPFSLVGALAISCLFFAFYLRLDRYLSPDRQPAASG